MHACRSTLEDPTCGVPGLAETDESLYELVDDLKTAGVTLDRTVPGVTRAAQGHWVDRLPAATAA